MLCWWGWRESSQHKSVLADCTRYTTQSGEVVDMSSEKRQELEDLILTMVGRSIIEPVFVFYGIYKRTWRVASLLVHIYLVPTGDVSQGLGARFYSRR